MNRNTETNGSGIAALHRALQAGETSCAEETYGYLQAIGRLDETLSAIISLNPAAMAEAEQRDAELRAGRPAGPLHGVAVVLKDNIETLGLPTTAGSKSLEGWQSGRDAFLVKKLRQAGAVILAKANLHEFAIWGESVSSMRGQAKNPYCLTRTPGGSSGGTGAAVAAGMALVGIGTDTVNSIRSPASACNLVGLRPTVGLVSRHGVVPYSLTQDTAGPITATVEDAARVLAVLAGYDEADAATQCLARRPPIGYLEALHGEGLQGKRLGFLCSLLGTRQLHLPVNAVMGSALDRMKEAGAELVHLHKEYHTEQLTQNVSVHLYELAGQLSAYLAGFGKNVPVHSVEEILESGLYTPDIEENLRRALALQADAEGYHKRLARRQALQKEVLELMEHHQLDALVYPHQQQLVCRIGESQQQRNGVLAASTGFPAVSVPGGFSPPSGEAPLGVPVGVEFMGRPFEEAALLEIAYAFEQTGPARLAPLL